MKKYILAAAAATALLATSGAAMAEKVTLQLKWVTQAQFAGYLVAQAKGFYKEAGLEVEIKPGGPDINPEQVVALTWLWTGCHRHWPPAKRASPLSTLPSPSSARA